MLIDMEMNKITFLIVLLLCMVSPSKATSNDVNQWLTKLDKSLEKSSVYQAQHEQHIQDLKKMITGYESLDARFEFTRRIFQAYLYYNADSAIVYAQKNMKIAAQLNKPDLIALAKCNLAFISVTSGDNIQAYKLMSSIDVSDMNITRPKTGCGMSKVTVLWHARSSRPFMRVMQKMLLIHCLHWFNQNRPIGFCIPSLRRT